MFKFTIRELFLLTVIVALACGWWLRERQLKADIERSELWRTRTGALEVALRGAGWDVSWDVKESCVNINWRNDRTLSSLTAPHSSYATDSYQPSLKD